MNGTRLSPDIVRFGRSVGSVGKSATASAKRLGLRAASLGATPLSQGGQPGIYEERTSPRESGVANAGLRRASLPPQSKTLSRELVLPTSKIYAQCPYPSAIYARKKAPTCPAKPQ
jgi:hypothetical protein